MTQMTDDEVRLKLRLYIAEHFYTKSNFAKHIGASNSFVSYLTTRDKMKQRKIPDEILELIGIKREVIYKKVTL